MTESNESLGTISKDGANFTARMEREVEHDIRSVWAMLTEPARFVDWLAPGELDLREGGRAQLDFVDSGIVIDSTISAFEPQRLLEYSWSGPGEPLRPVRFELEPKGETTVLRLTLTVPQEEDVARSCAGWEAHLMMLLAALEGVPIKFPFERFTQTRAAYNELVSALSQDSSR